MTTHRSRPPLTIVEALLDRALFGGLPAFRDLTTWRAWLVFFASLYGLPFASLASVGITEGDALELFRQHTGRSTYDPPAGGWREAACVVGRQSGKTRVAATIASFEAAIAPPEHDGTETYALLVAQDHRAALRALLAYARAPFDRVPVLKRSVVARRTETLTLQSGCVLAAYPCRPQSVRGLRARVVVADELAFYRSSEGFPTDAEMLRALRPCLATTDGRLIILSSPFAPAGALYELHRRHFGQDGANVLVWQATAPAMNPTLPADYLARMEQDDPEAYRSEVLGEFRAGVTTFLHPEALADCVDSGVRERPPAARHIEGTGRDQRWAGTVRYVGFVDASSGSGQDAFAIGIAHRDGDRAVLDVCRAWRPPFNPSGIIAEAASVLRSYRIIEVHGDRYAPGFVAEGFRAHGLTYRVAELTSSELFLEFLPRVNAGSVLLLDEPDLLSELRALERRVGSSGRDRISHRPGGHDDRAVAAVGALLRAGKKSRGAVWGRDDSRDTPSQLQRDHPGGVAIRHPWHQRASVPMVPGVSPSTHHGVLKTMHDRPISDTPRGWPKPPTTFRAG